MNKSKKDTFITILALVVIAIIVSGILVFFILKGEQYAFTTTTKSIFLII